LKAQNRGEVRRNFQGYTDDPATTMIGFGASSISKFPQGDLQNAVATSAYQDRVEHTGLTAHKGYAMNATDRLMARIIEDLLCRFELNSDALDAEFPDAKEAIHAIRVLLMQRFPDVFFINKGGLTMNAWAQPLVRIIASVVDDFSASDIAHSAAI